MFRKISLGLALACGALLSPFSHATVITKNFNFTSSEFTLKAEVTYEDTGPYFNFTDTGLTIHEFSTTLSGYTMPSLKYELSPGGGASFSGGGGTGTDQGMDDVNFEYFVDTDNGYASWNAQYTRGYGIVQQMTNLTFNQDANGPPSSHVPEPSTLPLLALAGLALVAARRRPAQRAASLANAV